LALEKPVEEAVKAVNEVTDILKSEVMKKYTTRAPDVVSYKL